MEDGSVGTLPTKSDEEFKPFIRRLPEFKFWYWATRAIAISFLCSWFEVFNVPVFWPVLVMYWFILFFLTSKLSLAYDIYRHERLTVDSAQANPAHDQVPLRSLHRWQEELRQEQFISEQSFQDNFLQHDRWLDPRDTRVSCINTKASFIKLHHNTMCVPRRVLQS